MGAEFLHVGCPMPVAADGLHLDHDEQVAVLTARIGKLDDEILDEVADELELIGFGDEDEEEWRAAARRRLVAGLDVFDEQRWDTSSIRIGDRWWIFAGGMSSGDTPSEAYAKLALLVLTEITDEPLRSDEVVSLNRDDARPSSAGEPNA